MKLAKRHIIKKSHRFWDEIDELSWHSKNLYNNAANYLIRQNFIYGHGYLHYNRMDKLMQKTEQYRSLPAKVSQQVLRGLDKNWQSLHSNEWIGSVDLGVDVLMAVTSNQPDFVSLLINGRPLKSLNQFYNKRKAFLQSYLKGNRQTSKRIKRLTRCRNQKVENFFNLDPLPVYKDTHSTESRDVRGETVEIPKFTGKRIKRGLYRTQTGFLCQADILGSYNILRKAFPNAFLGYGIERCVVHPRRINLSKPK